MPFMGTVVAKAKWVGLGRRRGAEWRAICGFGLLILRRAKIGACYCLTPCRCVAGLSSAGFLLPNLFFFLLLLVFPRLAPECRLAPQDGGWRGDGVGNERKMERNWREKMGEEVEGKMEGSMGGGTAGRAEKGRKEGKNGMRNGRRVRGGDGRKDGWGERWTEKRE